MIGDHDPEDSWDAGDPIAVRLELLERIVAALRASDDRHGPRLTNARRLAGKVGDELDVYRTRLHGIRHDLKRL